MTQTKNALLALILAWVAAAALACGVEPTPAASAPTSALPAATVVPSLPTSVPSTPTIEPLPSPAPVATPTPFLATVPATLMAAPTVAPALATPTAVPTQEAATEALSADATRALVAELSDETWQRLVALTTGFSPRESGTDQEKAAADYLAGEFRQMGYEAELQPFPFEFLNRQIPALRLNSPVDKELEGFGLMFAGTGKVTGPFVNVGKALPEDIPPEGIEGKIALIQRGEIFFEAKVSRVTEAGASAAVIYNDVPGMFGGRLQDQASIPAISISGESGDEIKELMSSGEVEATVSLVMETRQSRNVVVNKPGTAGLGDVVVLGAHFDTVADTQGANDNGSGVATLLTVAEAVSDVSYPFDIRFVTFGAEELGLFGSRAYVNALPREERQHIVAMLNFDVPGSGDHVELIGQLQLVGDLLKYSNAVGLDVKLGQALDGASSDHAPFREAGIPVVFFLAYDLSRINAPGDDLEYVDPELMGTAAVLGLELLDMLAREYGPVSSRPPRIIESP